METPSNPNLSRVVDVVVPDEHLTIPRGSPAWWSAHWRRTAAIGAILVLFIGTHIPKLAIGGPDDGPDKLLHLFAFAVVTFLLRISDLGRTTVRTAVIAVPIAILDEVTQELPGLNRSFDLLDLAADGGGIALALAWTAALSPSRRGSDAHRLEQRRRIASLRFLLASLQNWLHILVAGVLGAMLLGVLLGAGGRNPIIGPVTMTVVGGMSGFIAGVIAIVEAGRRHAMRRIDAEDRCLHCLRVLSPAADEAGIPRRCDCGFVDPGRPVTGGLPRRRLALRVVLSVLVIAPLGLVAQLLVMELGGSMPRLRSIQVWFTGLGPSTGMAFDAVLLGLVAAAVAGHARWRSAIDSEREGIRCLHCGHDVRGHRAEVELATCPECGAEFRTRDRPPVAKRAVSGDNDPRARS